MSSSRGDHFFNRAHDDHRSNNSNSSCKTEELGGAVSPFSYMLSPPPPRVRHRSKTVTSTLSSSSQQHLRRRLGDADTYQPLTKDRLTKKDKMDVLLHNKCTTTAIKKAARRRSISNGNIYRQRYNENNRPMSISIPFKRLASNRSDASVNSPNSHRNNRRQRLERIRQQKHHLAERKKYGKSTATSVDDKYNYTDSIISSSSRYNTMNSKRSWQNKSYTDNSSNRSKQTHDGITITSNNTLLHQQQQQDSLPRRYSGLTKRSAVHLALARTNNIKKQAELHKMFTKLLAVASRVVDMRSAEPSDTRMTVDELISLSQYLYSLWYGDHSGDGDVNSNNSSNIVHPIPVIPTIGLSAVDTLHETGSIQNERENEESLSDDLSLSPSTTTRKRNGHLSISPFGPIMPHSVSKRNNAIQVEDTTETDPLLALNGSRYNSLETQRKKPSSKNSKQKHVFRPLFQSLLSVYYTGVTTFQNAFKSILLDTRAAMSNNNNTKIQFEGWSLFTFSPISRTRLYLWKIIGSRWFEIFILFLLFTQWATLSFLPIRFSIDKPFFSCPGDFILFFINIVYTFEIVSKIIVYGLALKTRSSPLSWYKHMRATMVRRPSCCSQLYTDEEDRASSIISGYSHCHHLQHDDDTASNYTQHTIPHNQQLPAFAAQPSINSGSSIKSNPINRYSLYNNNSENESLLSAKACSMHTSSKGRNFFFGGHHNNEGNDEPLYQDSISDNEGYSAGNHEGMRTRGKRHLNNTKEVRPYGRSVLTTAQRHVLANLVPSLDGYEDDILKVKHGSFLSNEANIMDLVALVSYWTVVILLLGLGKQPWSVLLVFSAARPLRFLVVTEGTAVIMKSLKSSYDMLKNVMGFFMFFWLLFSLGGLFIFMNAFSRKCAVIPKGTELVKNMTGIDYVAPRLSCNGYMTSESDRTGVFDIYTGFQYAHLGGDGFSCSLGQVCIQDTRNQPGYGHISFENIWYTMLNILTVISKENWTELLYISQDSVSNLGSTLFFSLCIYLMTFIMVPMFIAVITTSFSHIRGDVRESAFTSEARRSRLCRKKSSKKKHKETNLIDESVYEDTGLGMTSMSQRRSKIQGWAHITTHSKWFRYMSSMLVVVNMTAMAFYGPEIARKKELWLEAMCRSFTAVFAVEILVRIFGYNDWKLFWSRKSNRIDLLLVTATVFDEIPFVKSSHYHTQLLIFSVLRSYRIAYLFPGALQLLSDVVGDGQGIFNLTFFTFLVLSLLAPICVQLFGGDFGFIKDNEPSMRFDNSYQAFLALFQIMTGENWTDILYDAMHSQEQASVTYAALFMIFLFFIMHYMALNLFVAVIMENFDLDEEEIKQIQIKKYIREHSWKPEYFNMDTISKFLLPLFAVQDEKKLDFRDIPKNLVASVTACRFKEFFYEEYSTSSFKSHEPTHNNCAEVSPIQKGYHRTSLAPSNLSSQFNTRAPIASQYSANRHIDALSAKYSSASCVETNTKYGDEYELNVARENKAVVMDNLNVFRSVMFLKNENSFRKACVHLATLRIYNWVVVNMICVSTVLAIWADEKTRDENEGLIAKVIEPIHILLLLFYWANVVVYMVADGMIMLPKSYLRSIWNLLDILNLTAQTAIVVLNASSGRVEYKCKYAGYLRVLRSLRLTRIVYYVNGMRIIFLDLVYGLPKMIDTVELNLLVFVPFAIYGCFMFSGKFNLCNDNRTSSRDRCWGEFRSEDDDSANILLPRAWKNPYDYSFDTFGKSLLHLFECASGEGWVLSMFSAMSVTTDVNHQPKFNWSSLSIFHSLYYVIFMFVASLCSIQLFIGVFLEIFKQRNGISSLTNTQRQFEDLKRQLGLTSPIIKLKKPDNPIRAFFYDLVYDKRGKFGRFMESVLLVNIVILATVHLHQPTWVTYIQSLMNAICLLLYLFEIGAKIVGLGFRKWTLSLWNVYDFMLVGLAIFTSIPWLFSEQTFAWDALRKLSFVGIAFRYAQRNESLDTLFRSAKRALPSIFFVTADFAIFVICFGVVFQENFSFTRYGPYGNDHANFRSFFNTILTLFRITTGENWDFLMHDFTVLPPECTGRGDCGSPSYAIILFITFYIVCTFIFVNLFTVIVIDNFSFTFDKRNQFTLITRSDLRYFKKAWSDVDPQATGYIKTAAIPTFLRSLNGVLSVRIYEEEHSLKNILGASHQADSNPNHWINIPVPQTSIVNIFPNDILSKHVFNLYEFNKTLSTIEQSTIKERKRQYTLVYQEIVNTVTPKGVSFHNMLEILAIRLVDISKSLTFDELVDRTRIQGRIGKELAAERAEGLVTMWFERQKFLKKRQKTRDFWLLYNTSSDLHGIDNCLSLSELLPLRERSALFFQNPLTVKYPELHNINFKEESSNTIPTIVVEPKNSLDSNSRNVCLFKQTATLSEQNTLQLPGKIPTVPSSSKSKRSGKGDENFYIKRKSISAIVPVTLGAPNIKSGSLPRRASVSVFDLSSLTSFMDQEIPLPITLQPKLPVFTVQPTSLMSNALSPNPSVSGTTKFNVSPNEDEAEDDMFIQYYSTSAVVDNMTKPDAIRIIKKLQHSTWSGLLCNENNYSFCPSTHK